MDDVKQAGREVETGAKKASRNWCVTSTELTPSRSRSLTISSLTVDEEIVKLSTTGSRTVTIS